MTKYKLQIFFFSVLLIFFTNIGHTQVGLNFQGVARKNDNSIISSQLISIKLSILQGAFESNIEYSEVRSVMTNAQGLFVVVIGDTGAISTLGNFNNINWKQSPKFLKIEMDPEGGDNFITMGTTQFQYVAYAKFASSVDAENIIGTIPVKSGGTGYTSLLDLKKALVLDKLNNTADLEKPISTLTKSALDLKLNISDSIKFVKKTYTDSLLLTKLNLSDTSKMISNRIAKDTLNLSYRINFKEDVSNKSTDINLGGSTPSDTLYPTQKAVKSYITSIPSGILSELARATNAENALETRIASNTVSITTEIARATISENALDTRIASNTASITTEITRATNAENVLDTRIASNIVSITSNTNAIAANTASITSISNTPVTYASISGVVPTWNQNTTGNAATATSAGTTSTSTKLTTPRNINGVAFDGTADIMVSADAGTLTGTTLKSSVTSSSLTSVGTLVSLDVNGRATNSSAFNATTSTTIDFTKSNLAFTSNSPGAFTLSGIKDGGAFTLAVQGTNVGTSTFTSNGFTFLSVNNGISTSGKHTLYTFIVMGTYVYYFMTSGF